MSQQFYNDVRDATKEPTPEGMLRKLINALERVQFATPAEVEAAIRKYVETSDDDIAFDDLPFSSEADTGVWVSAWVWVPQEAVYG